MERNLHSNNQFIQDLNFKNKFVNVDITPNKQYNTSLDAKRIIGLSSPFRIEDDPYGTKIDQIPPDVRARLNLEKIQKRSNVLAKPRIRQIPIDSKERSMEDANVV